QMNQVIEKLKALNLTDRQIQTSGINLYPVYEQKVQTAPDQLPNIIGYRASNNVTITINDVSQAPAILDGVVNVGANSVSGLQFGIKDDASLRQQALAAAAKQAQDKGKAIADALNVKITGIVAVTEQSSSAPMPLRDMAAASSAAAGAPVMTGEMTINAQVQVTYSYQ
ncbi:MAG: SIMPL domain-containing protein, partial [Chloroflexota bacterium]